MAQSEQIAQAALQAPINNLVIIVALIALFIVLLVGVTIWKVSPAIINLFKQLADNNSKLTDLSGQNSEQLRLVKETVQKNTDEMSRQTSAIEIQTVEIKTQSLDFRSYQTLVSHNLAAHTEQINANTTNIIDLKTSIDSLSEQIRTLIEDKIICASIVEAISKVREDVIIAIQQQKIATGNHATIEATKPE